MFQRFYPKHYVDSTYEIPFEQLYEQGFRGILFDIDNTLVPHGAPADERAEALFERLHNIGFVSCLISNNKEDRVNLFTKNIKTEFIFKAGKPRTRGYLAAMERLGTDIHNTMFVGDQLFTDIWGANRVGIETWLVKPIHPREEIQIVLKRKLEKIVLCAYEKEQERKRHDIN